MSRKHKLGLIFFVAASIFVTFTGEALAIIGMPLTPLSYAGVARRTVRRSMYMQQYYYHYPY